MKFRIALAVYNGKGAMATLEDFDEMGGSLDIAGGMSMTAKSACLSAAKKLRDAAARFELLAEEPNPFNYKTHNKVNRQKVAAETAQD